MNQKIFHPDQEPGWYVEKNRRGYYDGMAHYFYKSKRSLCGRINDCPNGFHQHTNYYKKCKKCLLVLTTYQDLDNYVNLQTSK